MTAHLQDRAAALGALGWTGRDAEWAAAHLPAQRGLPAPAVPRLHGSDQSGAGQPLRTAVRQRGGRAALERIPALALPDRRRGDPGGTSGGRHLRADSSGPGISGVPEHPVPRGVQRQRLQDRGLLPSHVGGRGLRGERLPDGGGGCLHPALPSLLRLRRTAG